MEKALSAVKNRGFHIDTIGILDITALYDVKIT